MSLKETFWNLAQLLGAGLPRVTLCHHSHDLAFKMVSIRGVAIYSSYSGTSLAIYCWLVGQCIDISHHNQLYSYIYRSRFIFLLGADMFGELICHVIICQFLLFCWWCDSVWTLLTFHPHVPWVDAHFAWPNPQVCWLMIKQINSLNG